MGMTSVHRIDDESFALLIDRKSVIASQNAPPVFSNPQESGSRVFRPKTLTPCRQFDGTRGIVATVFDARVDVTRAGREGFESVSDGHYILVGV